MQPSQAKEHFSSIERSINNAAQLCQTTTAVPDDLRSCISELEQESDHVKQAFAQENNDNRIIECIDRLEKLGDHAMQTCRQAGNTVDQQVQSAVQQAHDAISNLKHRLH